MSSEAFVLRLQDYREADRIVWLLSNEHGRLSALARGARNSRRRFTGQIDLFQRVRVEFAHRRGQGRLATLTEARALSSYPLLRQDPGRFAIACVVAELLTRIAPEGDIDPALFDCVGLVLETLADEKIAPGLGLAAAAVVRLLTAAGFVTNWIHCARCGRAVPSLEQPERERQPFALEHGGALVCGDCLSPRGTARRLSAADCLWLAQACRRMECAPATTSPGNVIGAAFDVLRGVTSGPLKAERFLFEILR